MAATAVTERAEQTRTRYTGPIVDCDVHHSWSSQEELIPYIAPEWRDYLRSAPVKAQSMHYPFAFGTNKQLDSYGPNGELPGTSYEVLRDQLLDGIGVTHAVLQYDVGEEMAHRNPFLAAAVSRAANDWCIDQWLSRDDRLHGAVLVTSQWPEAAAEEIRRIGRHERMVEVLLADNGIGMPYGHPVYYPIYEAAQEMNLPVAVHFGSPVWGGPALPTSGGLPMNRMEWYTLLNQPGMHQVTSLLAHGVFERFPELRFAVLEASCNWAPWVLWQLDGQFETLRRENPYLNALPSTYLHDHLWISTQPLEPGPRPSSQADLLQTAEGLRYNICFATDYPHWDTDTVDYVSRRFPQDWLPDLFYGNAARMFGWTGSAA
ncbi:amidohydrolase family protein [Pseudonocardia sp. RS010]|uniref:amidohydrolase family protein n=1 Tax=Pseudonocardia sp. RS010 TaxID=3385979 RepID=UPI0039A2F3E4